jgi:pimeloyl-ACP methyl ester carboxylesterase
VLQRTLHIDGSDGRTLEVTLSGPDGGRPLIFHTGTPSAGKIFPPMVAQGAERGLRHVSYSRPGYRGSDRDPGRSVADCASDVATIADALGIERFLCVGSSGGGPHALATAALLPKRTVAVATLVSPAPANAPGLDWLTGMGTENIAEFRVAQEGEERLIAYLEDRRSELLASGPADLRPTFGDLMSHADRDALTGELADDLGARTRDALEHGIWGWLDDDMALYNDWGFDVAEITVPVSVWHGQQDRFVPKEHGIWLAKNIPGASARLMAEHGHLSMVFAYDRVLDNLIAAADRS